ncbi:DNA cytosine methyltransferase [Streptomyces sp. NPDC006544]|uniref:DNA cytosine methyltransferase n=1 Tax=Streptomyces sp. NPDC006544 TaxID=3154583 RepID=UPI0033A3762D
MVSAGSLRSLEICTGIGGLALGLERSGFQPVGLVEKDPETCEALKGWYSSRPPSALTASSWRSTPGQVYRMSGRLRGSCIGDRYCEDQLHQKV